jgi:hypothetical protein
MPRLLSPDDACVQVDVPTVGGNRRYSGTTIDVTDSRHVDVLKAVGYVQADVSGGPARAKGYRCEPCGFASYFRRCSRCGDICER